MSRKQRGHVRQEKQRLIELWKRKCEILFHGILVDRAEREGGISTTEAERWFTKAEHQLDNPPVDDSSEAFERLGVRAVDLPDHEERWLHESAERDLSESCAHSAGSTPKWRGWEHAAAEVEQQRDKTCSEALDYWQQRVRWINTAEAHRLREALGEGGPQRRNAVYAALDAARGDREPPDAVPAPWVWPWERRSVRAGAEQVLQFLRHG